MRDIMSLITFYCVYSLGKKRANKKEVFTDYFHIVFYLLYSLVLRASNYITV